VIDLHSHLLPGLDDGARMLAESVAIAQAMEADGIRVVAATPHVRDDYPTSPDDMEQALAAVRRAASDAGLAIDIRGGGEIALDRLPQLTADERSRFGLGGNPGLLLVEFPYYGWPLALEPYCAALLRDGVVPVIAHPERNSEVQEAPGRLEEVVRLGGVVQLTAASIDGRLGRRAADCAWELLRRGLAQVIASDAHAPWLREAGMTAAVAAVGDPGLGRWLVEDAPAALLAGEAPSARPALPPRRWRGLRR
jgi:protein-tyrosine phosphatase